MSEEKDVPESDEAEKSEPERKFNQEHYDRLMKGQKPWLEFPRSRRGEGDRWGVFEKDRPDLASAIRKTVEAWNADPPQTALLEGADLSGAHLEGVELRWAHLKRVNLHRAHLEGACLIGAHLEGVELNGAYLEGVELNGAYLEGASLSGAHLEGADLGGAHLEGASLHWARLSGRTRLDPIHFGPEHNVMHDGSDSAVLSERRDRIANWGRIRRLGSLPLFGVSYVALSAALLTITAIGFMNQTEVVELLTYPVPLPRRVLWLLLSSSALAIGSTLYKLKCPPDVQAFSETQWVKQLGHPRLLYLRESLRRPWQVPTAVFLWLGASTGALLLLERVIEALFYVVEDLLGLW